MPAEIQSASGWSARTPAADLLQAGERLRGVGAERRHGHHPAQVQARRLRHLVGQPAHVLRPHPAAARVARPG